MGDSTRRAVLRRLARGPLPVSALARPFGMTLPSFLQHLDVLEACGLVRSRKAGRVRTVERVPSALAPAARWMEGASEPAPSLPRAARAKERAA